MTRFARAAVLSLLAGSLPVAASAGGQMAPRTTESPVLVVFFPDWSGAIDHAARDVIAQAAERAKGLPSARILVAGYADDTGSTAANVALTQLRAQRVADLLEADGVPAREIKLKAEGAQQVKGVASRRVEISISSR
jgi:outer membrane protein OmpA-like peptidoglycan-associated protein